MFRWGFVDQLCGTNSQTALYLLLFRFNHPHPATGAGSTDIFQPNRGWYPAMFLFHIPFRNAWATESDAAYFPSQSKA
jgi:hypothetical protein